ncbi:hypothetical protein RvY_16489 [Ramazzottius varieornatus]|uniref:Uncharacterized protein n=1 Tax=Ramazzottius varieornatus TaxID=947166 RepID=A0A1D1VYN8_RAMVA|nr:hypothetical protein RvY_16489 [Ramazzottius varieornatus]
MSKTQVAYMTLTVLEIAKSMISRLLTPSETLILERHFAPQKRIASDNIDLISWDVAP